MYSNKTKQFLFFVAVAALFVFIAFLLGVMPGCTLPSVTNSTWAGFVDDSTRSAVYTQYSDRTFYPYGASQNEGFSISIIKGIFTIFGLNSLNALLASFFVIYTIGFISMIYVSFKLSKSRVITLLTTLLFYISPFLLSQKVVLPVYIGILVLPLSFFIDYTVFQVFKQKELFWRKSTKCMLVKILLLIAASFFVKLIVVSTGWYTGFMCAFCSLAFFFLITVLDLKAKDYGNIKTKIVNLAVYVLIPWMAALAWIAMIMPPGTADFSYGVDRFYGSSIDSVTLLLPNENQLFSQIVPSVNNFIPENLMLTGSTAFWSNYMGYAMVSAIFVLQIKNKTNKKVSWTLILIAVVMLALSLGPALKFFALIDAEQYTYNLSMESSKVIFPWNGIYNIFPISAMRTVYRWFLMFQAIMILLFTILIGKAFLNKKRAYRILALTVSLICILEFLPVSIPNVINEKLSNFKTAEMLLKDIRGNLDGIIERDSVVAIGLGGNSNNKYLSAIMISGFDSHIYSGSGDKSAVLSNEYTPYNICELNSENDPREIARLITLIDERNLADYVVLPYYDMTSDIYSWPPDQTSIEEQKAIADDVESCLDGRYNVFHSDYYTVFKLNKPVEGSYYNIHSDDSLHFEKATDPYLGDIIYTVTAQSPLVFKLDTTHGQYDRLYGNFYMKFRQKNISGTVNLKIQLLDQNGDMIRETKRQFEITSKSDTSKFIKFEFNEPINVGADGKQLKVTLSSEQDFLLKIFSANLYCSKNIFSTFNEGMHFNFEANSLGVTGNGEMKESYIELYNGGIQYGPYINLSPGKYRVSVNGVNVDMSDFSVYSVANEQNIIIGTKKIEDISTSIRGVYEFELTNEDIIKQGYSILEEKLINVEFSNHSTVNTPVLIKRIDLELINLY